MLVQIHLVKNILKILWEVIRVKFRFILSSVLKIIITCISLITAIYKDELFHK